MKLHGFVFVFGWFLGVGATAKLWKWEVILWWRWSFSASCSHCWSTILLPTPCARIWVCVCLLLVSRSTCSIQCSIVHRGIEIDMIWNGRKYHMFSRQLTCLFYLFVCFIQIYRTLACESAPHCLGLSCFVVLETGAPFKADNAGLAFCRYKGSVCCTSAQDLQLQKQFKAMNISDPGCASLLKLILCAVEASFPLIWCC